MVVILRAMPASTMDDSALASAYKSGTTIRDLARSLGCSQKVIFERLVEAGAVRSPRTSAGRHRRLTVVQRREIIAAYRAGKPMSVIAAQFGVSDVTTRRIAARAGVPRRPGGSPRRLDRRKIRAMAAKGKPPAEIAELVGSSPDYIRSLLADRQKPAGATVRAAGKGRRSGPPPMDLDVDAIVSAYQAGERVQEIARRHGCSVALLYQRLRAAGVRLRGPRRPPVAAAEQIVAAYVAGWSMLDICATYGVVRSAVARLASEAGAPRRPSGAPRETDWSAIQQMIDQGASAKQAAEVAGCTVRQVARVLGKLGYEWTGRAWVRSPSPPTRAGSPVPPVRSRSGRSRDLSHGRPRSTVRAAAGS